MLECSISPEVQGVNYSLGPPISSPTNTRLINKTNGAVILALTILGQISAAAAKEIPCRKRYEDTGMSCTLRIFTLLFLTLIALAILNKTRQIG